MTPIFTFPLFVVMVPELARTFPLAEFVVIVPAFDVTAPDAFVVMAMVVLLQLFV